MPCFSRIKTRLTDPARIAAALKALGYDVKSQDDTAVLAESDARRIYFTRTGDAFSASGNTADLDAVSRKYAEIGIRQWAKRRGYSVVRSDDRSIELVSRRAL